MDLPLGSEVEVGSTEIDHRTVTILDTTVGAGRFGSVHRGHSSDPSYTMELAIKVNLGGGDGMGRRGEGRRVRWGGEGRGGGWDGEGRGGG